MSQFPIGDETQRSDDSPPGQREDSVKQALRGARRNRFRVGVVFGIIVTIAVVLLIVQNGESAQLDWVGFHFKMPLWILLVLTAVAGAIVWELVKVGWRRGKTQRRNQKAALAKARNSKHS